MCVAPNSYLPHSFARLQETGLIDYDKLAENAALFKPAMIICGGSAYPREWDYKRFRQIADDNGALLMMDMAHISGLVAAQEAADPFQYCDVVTTTTHKSLRGPRAGMIFFRKDDRGFEKKINQAVFPALQGGPHEHQIAAIATQLKEVATPDFKKYAQKASELPAATGPPCRPRTMLPVPLPARNNPTACALPSRVCMQVIANSRALAARLVSHGYVMATGGSDNHLVLWDLRPIGLTGSKLEKLCDEVCITLNKNSIYGDRSAMSPGGVRIGTPALTTRGFDEADFEKVADFLHEAVIIALDVQKSSGGKLLTDFVAGLKGRADITALRAKVRLCARTASAADETLSQQAHRVRGRQVMHIPLRPGCRLAGQRVLRNLPDARLRRGVHEVQAV